MIFSPFCAFWSECIIIHNLVVFENSINDIKFLYFKKYSGMLENVKHVKN